MDAIVFLYDTKSASAISMIRITDNVLIGLIAILFILLLTFLIRPIQRAVKNAFWDVHENSEGIIKMFNTMRNPLFLIKEDGEIVLVNSQGEKIIGDSIKEDKVKNIINSVQWLNLDITNIIEKIKIEECVEDIEGRIKNAEGEEIFFFLSGATGSYRGSEVIFLTINDYTIQKRAEEQMKAIAIRDELTGLYKRRR